MAQDIPNASSNYGSETAPICEQLRALLAPQGSVTGFVMAYARFSPRGRAVLTVLPDLQSAPCLALVRGGARDARDRRHDHHTVYWHGLRNAVSTSPACAESESHRRLIAVDLTTEDEVVAA